MDIFFEIYSLHLLLFILVSWGGGIFHEFRGKDKQSIGILSRKFYFTTV